jgi:hypothetical protein
MCSTGTATTATSHHLRLAYHRRPRALHRPFLRLTPDAAEVCVCALPQIKRRSLRCWRDFVGMRRYRRSTDVFGAANPLLNRRIAEGAKETGTCLFPDRSTTEADQ